MPMARAVISSRPCTATGGGDDTACTAERHSPAGPVRSVSPGPSRSRVDTRPLGRRHPMVRDPAAQVDAELLLRGADRPVGIGGAGDVVRGDRAPLELVRVKERRARPAVHHPRELPPDVVAVVHGGVHPGAAPRRDAVRGVADQEDLVASEAVGELCRRRERAEPLDHDRQVGDAGGEPDAVGQPVVARKLRVPHRRVEEVPVTPRVAGAGGQEQTLRLGVVDGVDAVPEIAERLPERRPDP